MDALDAFCPLPAVFGRVPDVWGDESVGASTGCVGCEGRGSMDCLAGAGGSTGTVLALPAALPVR